MTKTFSVTIVYNCHIGLHPGRKKKKARKKKEKGHSWVRKTTFPTMQSLFHLCPIHTHRSFCSKRHTRSYKEIFTGLSTDVLFPKISCLITIYTAKVYVLCTWSPIDIIIILLFSSGKYLSRVSSRYFLRVSITIVDCVI